MRSHTFSIQIFCGSVVFMLQLANPHPHAGRSWTSAGLPSKRIPFRFPNLNLDRGDAEPREAEKAQQELGGELFGVLRIRGGEKPDKERKTPIYEQLREAEELFQKGVLSEEEFSKERGWGSTYCPKHLWPMMTSVMLLSGGWWWSWRRGA